MTPLIDLSTEAKQLKLPRLNVSLVGRSDKKIGFIKTLVDDIIEKCMCFKLLESRWKTKKNTKEGEQGNREKMNRKSRHSKKDQTESTVGYREGEKGL